MSKENDSVAINLMYVYGTYNYSGVISAVDLYEWIHWHLGGNLEFRTQRIEQRLMHFLSVHRLPKLTQKHTN